MPLRRYRWTFPHLTASDSQGKHGTTIQLKCNVTLHSLFKSTFPRITKKTFDFCNIAELKSIKGIKVCFSYSILQREKNNCRVLPVVCGMADSIELFRCSSKYCCSSWRCSNLRKHNFSAICTDRFIPFIHYWRQNIEGIYHDTWVVIMI